MRCFLCVLMILAFDSVTAFARLGETYEQCVERYGNSTKQVQTDLANHAGAEFQKNGLRIEAFFDRTTGRCVWIKYWGVAGDQAGALVDLNTQGSTWGPPRTTRVNAAGMNDTVTNWHREDGALATSSVFLRVLEIKTKDVMDNKSRQDEETRKRDRGRSVEGF